LTKLRVQVLCFHYFNGAVGKPLMGRCALSLFYNVFTFCGEVLNIESFFTENLIKSKLKIIVEFGPTLGSVRKPPQ
jgi:hypothetical protein